MVLKGRWPAARARPVRPLILSRPCYSCLLGYLALLAPSLTLYFLTKILCPSANLLHAYFGTENQLELVEQVTSEEHFAFQLIRMCPFI